MAYAVQCYFDNSFSQIVKAIWKEVGACGGRDLEMEYGAKPGFTLAVYETEDFESILKHIRSFAETTTPPRVAFYRIKYFDYIVDHPVYREEVRIDGRKPFPITVGFPDAMDYPKDLKLKLEDKRDYKSKRPLSIEILRLPLLLTFQKRFLDFMSPLFAPALSIYYLPQEWFPHCPLVAYGEGDLKLKPQPRWDANDSFPKLGSAMGCLNKYSFVGTEASIVSFGLVETSSAVSLGEVTFSELKA